VWLVGEFGEMLVNGSAKNPEGENIQIPHEEIMDIYEQVLEEHFKKGGRSDTIICWALTGLSKLSIRLTDQHAKIISLVEQFQDHMNIEIQQRACEFLKLLEKKWDPER
jgi:hypothetical protein